MFFSFACAVQVGFVRYLKVFVICLSALPNIVMAESSLSGLGEYVGAGCPLLSAADSCNATTAGDRVRIFRDSNSNVIVSVRIVFDKGHICKIEGLAIREEGNYILRSDGLDQDKPCQLNLLISGAELKLSDPSGLCREVYCGVRGTFDGAVFKKLP